jgi:hypothetical protein
MLEIILVRVGGWMAGWVAVWVGGCVGGWVGGTVIIRLNSVQLQLQLPAGTELGNICYNSLNVTIIFFSVFEFLSHF